MFFKIILSNATRLLIIYHASKHANVYTGTLMYRLCNEETPKRYLK